MKDNYSELIANCTGRDYVVVNDNGSDLLLIQLGMLTLVRPYEGLGLGLNASLYASLYVSVHCTGLDCTAPHYSNLKFSQTF